MLKTIIEKIDYQISLLSQYFEMPEEDKPQGVTINVLDEIEALCKLKKLVPDNLRNTPFYGNMFSSTSGTKQYWAFESGCQFYSVNY